MGSVASRLLASDVVRFLIVGCCTVVVDYSTYLICLSLFQASIPVSKSIGFIVGTTCAYFANKHWTFRGNEPQGTAIARFLAVYAVTLAVNVIANQAFLYVGEGLPFIITIAFVLATIISAALNFVGMKFLVFPPTARPGSDA